MKIDHVSVGGSDLAMMERSFSEANMMTEYGGPHSSGGTKMSLLGFRDGSYIELISTVRPDVRAANWSLQIEGNGGPCAWAVAEDDIAAQVAKAKRFGIPASGPGDYSRRRPDGVLVEWELGFLGEGDIGSGTALHDQGHDAQRVEGEAVAERLRRRPEGGPHGRDRRSGHCKERAAL